MINIDVALAVLAGALGTGTFLLGRLSAAKASGTEWGRLKADISHIKDDVAEVKAALHTHTDRQTADVQRLDTRIDNMKIYPLRQGPANP